jgi:PhzF family phenazine biosynthesis protein
VTGFEHHDADVDVQRWAAFAAVEGGGNPAGVVLDAAGLDDAGMLRIAAEVAYSETAFVTHADAAGRRARIRYFSPGAEVPFCGHATIATAVSLAGRWGEGPLLFDTPVGPVEIATSATAGAVEAAFTSVEPTVEPLEPDVLAELLGLLGLETRDLDPALPPRVAFAGNRHPVLVLADRARFDGFRFDPAAVRSLMDREGWAGTVTVLWRQSAERLTARNLFPVGDIREDPATGSAAASTGAYLRSIGGVEPPATVTIDQGAHVGRPSVLTVDIPTSGGITVRGSAAPISVGS